MLETEFFCVKIRSSKQGTAQNKKCFLFRGFVVQYQRYKIKERPWYESFNLGR